MSLLTELKKIDDMHRNGDITQTQHDIQSAEAIRNYTPALHNTNQNKLIFIAIILSIIGLSQTGIPGIPGIPGINGINGSNGTDDISWKTTKINKSGDTITGQINFSNQSLRKAGDIYQTDQFNPDGKELISYQAWDVGGTAINFFSNSRKYNNSAFAWEMMDAPSYPGGSFILFGGEFIYTNFPPNSTTDTRQFEYSSIPDVLLVHANLTVDENKHITISSPGKGIQLTSPNGAATACLTLSNLSILTVTPGVCA